MKFIVSLFIMLFSLSAIAKPVSYEKITITVPATIVDGSDVASVLQVAGVIAEIGDYESHQRFDSHTTDSNRLFTGVQKGRFGKSKSINIGTYKPAINQTLQALNSYASQNRQSNRSRMCSGRIQGGNSIIQGSYTTLQNHTRAEKRNHSNPQKVHPKTGQVLGLDRWRIPIDYHSIGCAKIF